METIGLGLTYILTGLASLLGIWILTNVILLLNIYVNKEKSGFMSTLALKVVQSVQQELSELNNDSKKAEAVKRLTAIFNSFNIKLNEDVINTWVEDAVKKLKDTLPN